MSKTWLPWAALGVVYTVWGSTYLAVRFTVETMPPMLSSGSRFLVAGVVLTAGVLVFAGRSALRMTWAQFGTSALAGLLLPAWGNGLVVIAERHVASGLAALLVACMPIYVVVLRFVLGEKPPRVTILGVALGIGGLAVLLLGGPVEGAHGSAWYGPWLVVVAALGWAVGSVASTRLPVPANPFAMTAVEMLVGGSALLTTGFLTGERARLSDYSATSWGGWLYLVTFGSLLAFSSYVYILGKLPVSTAATYAYVNPVIAVLLGVVFANEVFGAWQWAGGAIVLAAVVLVVRAERSSVSVGSGTIAEPVPSR
ncbi:EamA family transporter [Actinokineospora auranticolor]|uniref:EamA domain-containing membrane protein RarD n=1 Tax=Actinokineospora auranticolor TaxID=155976 RepID=A0A2S6GQF8_9PSEU|nr:EamA family transporter [Actinokineospora auranticolor]PPK67464.1 EamA domain-containing membrane protein RarD [Actinokineospora auranticolor]